MTLPDVDVQIADAPAQRFADPSPANWMVVGIAERGPIGTPLLVRSASEFRSFYGVREASDAFLYDSLDVYFREGGKNAYVSRLGGPDQATATAELDDDTLPSLNVTATSPGEWADDISLDVETFSGGFSIDVLYDGALVESSGTLESQGEAVLWSAQSAYVRLEAVDGRDNPIEQTVSLTGGDDDRADITTDEIEAALAVFARDLGPGQVSIPGVPAEVVADAVLAHAEVHKRIAKLDPAGGLRDAEDLIAVASALRTTDGHEFGALFWPWDTCPGVSPGTSRTVPPSARNAALFARSLASGGTPGDLAGGENLPARYVDGIADPAVSDAVREQLNDAGVNVSRVIRGTVYTFGNRTVANPLTEGNWAQLNQSTVIAAIASRAYEIGGRYVHSKVDGKGIRIGNLEGELTGMMLTEFYTPGDLYGDSPADAFRVIPAVDIADATATLVATIEARVSPGADRVEIPIYKQPIAG